MLGECCSMLWRRLFMLIATPKEIIGKFRYINQEPVPIYELSEDEQKVFDEFYYTFMQERSLRFESEDD